MFACAACGRIGDGGLCPPCRLTLGRGPMMRTPSGVQVTAAYCHEGAARRLVHQLKYTGAPEAAAILGKAMAAVLPPTATAVVPVARARLRRWRNGVDPAVELARVMARHTGLPVVPALDPAWWWSRHAGRPRHLRSAPRWRCRSLAESGWVLIDDVLTTGATIEAAAGLLGPAAHLSVVATSPGRVGGVRGPSPAPSNLEVAWRVARSCWLSEHRQGPAATTPRS